MEETHPTNSFTLLRLYLGQRLTSPIRHVSFWTYLVLAVLAFGALGVWVEVVRLCRGTGELAAVLTAIYTYFPAVAVSAALQMDMDESGRKYVRSFALCAFVVIVGLALMHAAEFFGRAALPFGLLGVLLATVLWWIANGVNPSFQDFDPKAALGGETTEPPKGDTTGYRT